MRSFKARRSPTLITNWWDEENVQSANFIIKILLKALMDRSLILQGVSLEAFL